MAQKSKAQELAERLATHEHVIRATAIGRRLTVVFPRERGGYTHMDVTDAAKLAERLGV